MIGMIAMVNLTQGQQSPADSAKMFRNDSLKLVKQQKRVSELTLRIDEDKQKLIKLENSLIEKADNKDRALREAEESANGSHQATGNLTGDAMDKKKARRAEKRSDEARRDAKTARRAASSHKELENDISRLKKRIAKDEKTLSELNPSSTTTISNN